MLIQLGPRAMLIQKGSTANAYSDPKSEERSFGDPLLMLSDGTNS